MHAHACASSSRLLAPSRDFIPFFHRKKLLQTQVSWMVIPAGRTGIASTDRMQTGPSLMRSGAQIRRCCCLFPFDHRQRLQRAVHRRIELVDGFNKRIFRASQAKKGSRGLTGTGKGTQSKHTQRNE